MKPEMRRLPAGAEICPEGVRFRVWAPASKQVTVVFPEKETRLLLEPEGDGYHAGVAKGAEAGTIYRFRLGSGDFPDPVSRYQPEGPHGPSEVIDPAAFIWTDQAWKGVQREGQVIYEMHIGTFTQGGTWHSAAEQLPGLKDVGITLLEVMPVADFAGRFGWGYDGVGLFAPTWLYGKPDDFRFFVNRAHELGLGVILDVVYNHFGPDGCYLRKFSPDYFTKKYDNEWGEAINFDGKNSGPVREYFVANAGYWITEFHLDGLRLDATQQIFDDSPEHILTLVSRKVRAAAGGRGTYIVNENEPQHVHLVQPEESGGFGMDSLWNDDFHHSAMVALTGRNEAYYTDYLGKPQEFISAAKYGYLYQGQRYKWQQARRGTPSLALHPSQFVNFIQNHDQVANSLCGRRLHEVAAPGALRAITALLLLGPNTPMLFQGQEFASSTKFLYFADHQPELAKLVAEGRCKFLQQFPSVACLEEEAARIISAPEAEETFRRCKLDHTEREKHAEQYALHKSLLTLRREEPAFAEVRYRGLDGAVLGEQCFLLRYFHEKGDRLLLVNLGADLHLDPAPEPLLAPLEGRRWELLWSSECPEYGGSGTPPVDTEQNWMIPGHAAVVLQPADCQKGAT